VSTVEFTRKEANEQKANKILLPGISAGNDIALSYFENRGRLGVRLLCSLQAVLTMMQKAAAVSKRMPLADSAAK
jgi:hypothetical protein